MRLCLGIDPGLQPHRTNSNYMSTELKANLNVHRCPWAGNHEVMSEVPIGTQDAGARIALCEESAWIEVKGIQSQDIPIEVSVRYAPGNWCATPESMTDYVRRVIKAGGHCEEMAETVLRSIVEEITPRHVNIRVERFLQTGVAASIERTWNTGVTDEQD